MESITLIHEILDNKECAYDVYTELIFHLKRCMVIESETRNIENYKTIPELLLTSSLLFFSLLLECEDHKLCFLIREANAHFILNQILKTRKDFKRQFKKLNTFLKQL